MGRAGLVSWEGGVNRIDGSLITVVLLHLAITIVHGQAHSGAAIPLPLAATLFVYLVILACPLVGLALTRWRPVAGAWVVAASLGGALVFGLVNHFIIAGPDHAPSARGPVADADDRSTARQASAMWRTR